MSDAVIGLESMPNVYFSSINIEGDLLSAKLTMKDFVDNPTWSNSDILRGLLNIKIVALSYNTGDTAEDISESLTNGTESIHQITEYPTRILSAHDFIEAETLTTDNINNFYYDFKITPNSLDLSKENIFVFGLAYIDLTAMNLDYANYKYLDGPMVSESVRVSGQSPIKGTLFRLEDGSIWSGPVHEHEGGYMEGSFHREEPHGDLTQEQVESKVSEFMYTLGASEQEQTIHEFEEFYHYEQNLETSIVVLDAVNLALNEFQSARQLFNTNEEYFYELMKSFTIPQFEIRKAPLKRRLEFMDIGTNNWVYDSSLENILIRTSMVNGAFDERFEMKYYSRQFNVNPNNLVEATGNSFDINTQSTFDASNKIGYIKQLPSNERFLYNLLIVDEEYFGDDSEDYKVKLNIDVVDSFKIELENTKQDLLSIISDLSTTYNSLFGKLDKERIINFFAGNGVLIGDNLEFIRIDSQGLFDKSIFSRLSAALRKTLLAMLSNSQVIEGVIDNTLKNLYINSVSKENYNTVILFLTNLIDRFIIKYNLSPTNGNSVLTNSTVSRVEREIKKVIEVKRVLDGNFSFFNKNYSQRIITLADMRSRAEAEYNKFFNRRISGAEIQRISSDISQNDANNMADFEATKFTFFTPTNYRYGDESIDLGQPDISIFDEKKHNLITNHMFEIKSRKRKPTTRGKPKRRLKNGKRSKRNKMKLLTTLSVRKPFKKSTAIDDDNRFENAEDYLGSSSPFLSMTLDTRRKPLPINEGPPTLIKKSFAQNRKITKFDQVSLNNENSFLLNNSSNIDFSRLPLQFRALVLSNYNLSRFSFPLEEAKLLENPTTATAINNIFNRIRIARYLDGFEVKQNGLRNMNSPIYLPLNETAMTSGRTLMINLTEFKNSIFQAEEEDNIPASNSFVMIEGTAEPTPPQPDGPPPIEISDREEKEFSTTNIVLQNQMRQELTSFDNTVTLETITSAPTVPSRSSLRPTRSGRATSSTRTPTRSGRTTTRGTSAPRSTPRSTGGGGSSGGGY
jgi:hypothetical protein